MSYGLFFLSDSAEFFALLAVFVLSAKRKVKVLQTLIKLCTRRKYAASIRIYCREQMKNLYICTFTSTYSLTRSIRLRTILASLKTFSLFWPEKNIAISSSLIRVFLSFELVARMKFNVPSYFFPGAKLHWLSGFQIAERYIERQKRERSIIKCS